jgi:predicted transcriptional regulator
MKRTTIYLDAELESLLKAETLRRKRPMADLVREAVREYVTRTAAAPPGAGALSSGRRTTAENAERTLAATAFGRRG